MLISLTTLLATLSSIFRSRAALQLENLALRHQIGILQRSARKRPKLTPADRLLWVALSRIWRDWRSALAIVKPETVVAWHRAGSRKLQRAVGSTFCGAQDSITDTSVALPSQSQATDADAWLADLDTASPDLRHRSRLFLN